MFFTPSIQRKTKWFIFKSLSLLSVIRGYNILVLILAQYLSSIFILSEENSIKSVLFDKKLFALILSSAICIASGYIINNFYDSEKDLINRPFKSKLDRIVSKQNKLNIYFILNFIAIIIASYVSFKAVLFFSVYIFCLWLYSHKLKRKTIIGNISATILSILPFFVVFIYYKNFDTVIFFHALFLVLILFMKELIKDLENLTGDLTSGYNTIPAKYGEKTTKKILFIFSIACIATAITLIYKFPLGYMHYYFWCCILFMTIFSVLTIKFNYKKQFNILHNLLKFIIVLGVFSILLIKPNIVNYYLFN